MREIVIQNQLLATKFFAPTASHALIPRPYLMSLLYESLNYPITLISTPAGFGKTMLLSAWRQAQPIDRSLIAWVSLDEGDNDPRQFWIYVLAALDAQQPERFTALFKEIQSPQLPPLTYILARLIHLLAASIQDVVLILDDYHVITDPQVHTTLLYLLEHISPHFHIILATRADPPLPFSLLRARQQILEVRTNQLRCSPVETRAFFHEVMGLEFSQETIQEVTARTEGWLVGLQLLGLSLHDCANPVTLLKEVSGDQRYILDYLIDEVLRRQPQDIQRFLLSTSILEQLNASLCDAVLQQDGSQQILEWLTHANLFVVSLDTKHQWYRYHALFAEALRYRLENTHGDLVPILHYHASVWYAEHYHTTKAILHALSGHHWSWAADLIERSPSLVSLTWGPREHELVLLRHWLEQLPTDIVHSRPRLCLACAQMLWAFAPQAKLDAWLETAEATLSASLIVQAQQEIECGIRDSQTRQEQENLLGEVIAFQALLLSYQQGENTALVLCQRALALLAAENRIVRAQVIYAQVHALYCSSANDAATAIEKGLAAGSLAQAAGQPALAISIMALTAMYMLGAGRLHEAYQLSQQAMLLGTKSEELVLPEVGYPALFQADILREWNELDAARSLVEKALSLCEQAESMVSLAFLLYGHVMLLRITLSRGELDAARSALQQIERIGMSLNQPTFISIRCLFTTVDQVKFWLAAGELNCATQWAEELELRTRYGSPFAYEREEVARARVFLAQAQSAVALKQLEPLLIRTTTAQRWNHVIEIRLLQAQAYYRCQQEAEALGVLSQAVEMAEPEGYIRCFVDEGPPMAFLLSRLKQQLCKKGPTPYLDRVLAAFTQQGKVRKRSSNKQVRTRTKKSAVHE